MKKIAAVMTGLAGLLTAGILFAYTMDTPLEATVLHLLAAGTRAFDVTIDTRLADNALRVRNQVTATDPIIISTNTQILLAYAQGTTNIGTATAAVDIASQKELGLGNYTTAQLQATTPARVGTIVYNTTLSLACVSTGTAIDSYARVSNASGCN